MIDRELVESMFAQMHEAGIETDEPLLWGYFFVHSEPSVLEEIGEELARQGYRVVEIFEVEKKEQGEAASFTLHVEKVETHTVDSLDRRNRKLDSLARRHGIDSYDGMDVGRADGKAFDE